MNNHDDFPFDLTDEEPTIPNRDGYDLKPADTIPLTFVGTTSKNVDFCRSEFAGLSIPQITEEIKGVLRSIDPSVDYFEHDIVLAAEALAE